MGSQRGPTELCQCNSGACEPWQGGGNDGRERRWEFLQLDLLQNFVVKLGCQSRTHSAYMWVHTLSLEPSLEDIGAPGGHDSLRTMLLP